MFFLGSLWVKFTPFRCAFKSLHLAMGESFLKRLVDVANN